MKLTSLDYFVRKCQKLTIYILCWTDKGNMSDRQPGLYLSCKEVVCQMYINSEFYRELDRIADSYCRVNVIKTPYFSSTKTLLDDILCRTDNFFFMRLA